MRNHEDKYKKKEGRKAARKGKDSEFLNKDALDADLVSSDDLNTEDHGRIVDSENQENQEWNAREEQNKDNPSHP